MSAEEFRVVIFDDAETDIYREVAAETVREAGGKPDVFDQVDPAWDSLHDDDVRALISGLGTRERPVFGYRHPARPLLRESYRLGLPLALLSGRPDAADHIDSKAGDIVVPKQPYEEIAPALQGWLASLTTGSIRTQA